MNCRGRGRRRRDGGVVAVHAWRLVGDAHGADRDGRACGNVTKSVSTSGTVAAQSTSNLGFEISGRVTKVNVTLGQQVKKGRCARGDRFDRHAERAGVREARLSTAQAKLNTTASRRHCVRAAPADQSLQQAEANYSKAVRALETLQQPADTWRWNRPDRR